MPENLYQVSTREKPSKTPSEIDFFERLKSGEIIDLEIYRQEEKRLSASLAELHQDYAAAVKKNLGQESSAKSGGTHRFSRQTLIPAIPVL